MESSKKSVVSNLEQIKNDIGKVHLVAVTKTVGIEDIKLLKSAGHSVFGENRIHIAEEKIKNIPGTWHMIGHVQSNKAKKAVELFDWIDTIDSLKLAKKISYAAVDLGKTINVLVQVNIGEEDQKYGILAEDLPALLEEMRNLPNLKVRGLMAMAPHLNPEETRPYFKKMKQLFDIVKGDNPGMDHLSMGMTNDYKIAIVEGSTMVRIGTALWS